MLSSKNLQVDKSTRRGLEKLTPGAISCLLLHYKEGRICPKLFS